MPKKSPAAYVIEQFDGIRPLARLMKKCPSTIWEWIKQRDETGRGRSGIIPSKHHKELLRLARKHGKDVTPTDLVMGR